MTAANTLTSNYDVIFLGIILFSTVMALIRGALAEVLSLSVWFITFAVMRHYGSLIDSRIPENITNPLFRSSIIFVITFIVVAIAIAIIKKLCASIISSIGLGGLNYLLGALFGIIRGVLICAILIIVIEMLKFDPTHSWQQSRLAFVLVPSVKWISQTIPRQIENLPATPDVHLKLGFI